MKRNIIGGAVILFTISIFLYWKYSDTNKTVTRDFPQIIQSDTLKVATDYNPTGYYVSGDSIAGFNHDMIELLQTYTPVHISVTLESKLENSISGLNNGTYDIVVRSIPITSQLRDTLSFTTPIMNNKQVLVQRKKEYNNGVEPIRSHLQLAKKTLHVPQNSPSILRIKNLAHEIGDTIYYVEDNLYESEQLIMQVASGDIDYTVCDERIAKALSESLPEIDYKTLIGFTHLEGWAVRKNAPILLDSLNKWIDSIKISEQYKNLFSKYYKE